MDDPLAFPVLAGAALTQGFNFLYDELQALLERRRAQREGRPLPVAEALRTPPVLAGRMGPLNVDDSLLAEKAEELSLLNSLLEQYTGLSELDGQDPQLRIILGRLRATLETIYGQRLTFHLEDRPTTGVRINQSVDDVSGELIGLDAGALGERARAEVSQNVGTVHSDSTVVGARFDTLG
ncbi:hypothetical protein ABZU53_22270 [Micromonospora sp. NPDC005194]|uniref:hypothetical protein n=1 Tax=Micromonospora sp. NPDC005194 TaxID=3156870 RepID=UPI0033A14545